MCGIFGIILKPGTNYQSKAISESLVKIALLSESRGQDSSGIAFRDQIDRSIQVIKGDIPVSSLIKNSIFDDRLREALNSYHKGVGFSVFGHARLVTNGSQLNEENNQPVIKEGILVIHNGIIVNVDSVWNKHAQLKREYKIDTEVIPALVRDGQNAKKSLLEASNRAFKELEGTFSIAMMLNDHDEFILATNNGSLYYTTDRENYFVFASENYFLERLIKEKSFSLIGTNNEVIPLCSNIGVSVNMNTLKIKEYSVVQLEDLPETFAASEEFNIKKSLIENQENRSEVIIDPFIYSSQSKEKSFLDLLANNTDAILNLKRCTRCLLPETFPFIEFDESGTCNYCRNYQLKNQAKPIDELLHFLEPYRNKNGKTNCIVPFSGGRDSSFTLHFVKRELGLNPIAFTYDWGMVTDLARRNAARICGKLGIENIIVAANIRKKRENIRKNIIAWLKRPHLGMIPLFMAGDKYFFHYSNKILSQTNLDLSIWGSNPLENTDFKSGFAGIRPQFSKKRIDELKLAKKIELSTFFSKQYLANPAYFNSSLLDTFGAFTSRYLIGRHGYIQLFDYIQWDEDRINDLIINEYNWEKSIDTDSTWRIGDGTAAFYNYIYHTVAGFSENDTFRSNQIREGQLSREKGLELIMLENRPRYENLRWYLAMVGLDFESTIKRINSIPKLYQAK